MNEDFEDVTLVCARCREDFVWTAGEKSFMYDLFDKGKLESGVIAPKRCRECRAKNRREREALN